jgi:RimJ/RimL family protein N-acetyltransferase
MDAEFQIRPVGPPQRELLIQMYDRFDPLGVAFGLPPRTLEGRRHWIADALGHTVNVAAFSPSGDVVGHCFLAGDNPGSAELAVFVRQDSRRKGVGAALLRAALKCGNAIGLRRVWSMTAPDNVAALRLQQSCGFRITKIVYPAIELEIPLPVAYADQDLLEPACVA